MGYFSKSDLTHKEKYIDQSYHGFEEQLLWRYEDLKDRYRELLDSDASVNGDDRFTRNDYRYYPISYFTTVEDVYRAMEIAREDLEEKCGIIVREDGSVEYKDEQEADPDQISIVEIVLLPTWFQTVAAA